MTGKICGTGFQVPSYVMDNFQMAELVDTSDDWIRERTGIAARHVAITETTASMAWEAGRRAMENGGITPEEIDMIVVATSTGDMIFPCTASQVQQALGASGAACFDLSAACTGFVLAYHTAMAYIQAEIYRTALVIGSDCLTRTVNWKDRSSCILFGDGAGAVILKASEGRKYLPVSHSDGRLGKAITCRSRHDRNCLDEKQKEKDFLNPVYSMEMDGQAVFRFAVKRVPEVIHEVLEKNHVLPEEISWYILHQANQRIIEAAARRLGEPMEKFPVNIGNYGNTSSASIPILLAEMASQGMVKKGQKLVMVGYGAGLSWSAAIVEW